LTWSQVKTQVNAIILHIIIAIHHLVFRARTLQ